MRRTPICNNEIGSLSNRLRNNCQSVKDDSEVVFKSTAKTPRERGTIFDPMSTHANSVSPRMRRDYVSFHPRLIAPIEKLL
jgi:hypothetical protein